MKERFTTMLCALGALALFFTMFFHGDERGETGKDAPRPTTEERDGNGYHAAMEWLTAEHIRVLSLRDRFDQLERQRGLTPAGNILIVTLPATTVFKTDEFRPLDRWVRKGNTLLVMAALADNPDWAFALAGMTAGDLNLLTGLEFETVKSRDLRQRDVARSVARPPEDEKGGLGSRLAAASRKLAESRRSTLIANRPHAYFAGVHEGSALSDYPSQAWTVKVPYEGFVFTLAHQGETGEGVLWTRPLGSGRLIVSGLGSLFTNRALGLADNGRLLANIVGADLGPRGSVVFDDAHQGLGSAYDPARFYRDRRLHLTVGILVLVWLSWVIGATQLRMRVARASVPREVELVRATGGFLARVLTPGAAAGRMFEHFLRRSSWEILERHPRIAPADVRQLRNWHARLGTSKQVPLARLHNLIVRINRQLNS